MRAIRNTAVTEGNDNQVDLTPMLDVVFILLIFFIITASFAQEHTLATHINDNSKEAAKSDITSTTIMVQEDNTVKIDNRIVSTKAIRSILTSLQVEYAGKTNLVIRAHENSSTNTYTSILDAAKKAEILNVMMEPYKES